jgi:urease subunit alpha
MIVMNHGGSMAVPEDIELARERVHPATMAAEGPLHELGSIAIVNSDSQGMGRIMESFRRTLQLADTMKRWRATDGRAGLPGLPPASADPRDDTDRVLRYLAKVTIEPAIVHGVAEWVGSLQPGRLADIVLWSPAWFGVKPEIVLKAGCWPGRRSATATPPSSGPSRPATGPIGAACRPRRAGWASRSPRQAMGLGSAAGRGRAAKSSRSAGRRGLTRADLHPNRATARSRSTRPTGGSQLGGRELAVEPVKQVPLSRRYFLR